ncbi:PLASMODESMATA CALLOSE-BINDING PROTEIN 3-like [Rhodamnia argentea]|uniref:PLASMODESMATA CALLOSE-BINDING PROTEIN 3-like n=1 Tax=Rhodamnia argentea TaxID=178133 RepID=A0A8B8MXB9_9MYRT|nr:PLASMODESMATA CALLOSE-BINDING PROTEIN 3-like [Rhodamnia argentea]XP_048136532.1 PLASMODESMATA CALLOSE-BINDING PROTEIN 3-like [Rhodamnia argentea]
MAFLAFLMLLLAMAGCSSATYCICKDGVGDSALQKTLDYACGAGADCSPILQNGACYNPNTVKDHCNYAVNSYFQKKGEVTGSCDFSGTATTSASVPNQASGCVYPASASSASTTPTGTPTTATTPTGSNSTGTTPTTSTTPTTTTTTPSSTPVFNSGLGPTGITDSNDAAMSIQRASTVLALTTTFWFSLSLALWA